MSYNTCGKGAGTCGGGSCKNPCKKKTSDEPWPKKCGCGAVISEEQWENLRYVGIQKSGYGDFPDAELRNCEKCGSTLAIEVTDDFA